MSNDNLKQSDLTPVLIDDNLHLNKNKVIGAIIIIVLLIMVCFLFKKPSVALIGDKVEKVSYKSEFIDSGITVKYYGQDITNQVVLSTNINTNELGEYEVKYKIPYIFGTYVYKRKAVVVDDMAPEIILEGDQEYKVSYKKKYKEPGYKAIDNYNGDVTDNIKVSFRIINDGETDVIYKVADSSGNKQEKIRKIYLVDDIKPTIDLIGDGTVILNIGEEYKEQGAKAQDEKDGDLTDRIEITGDVNTNQEGTYSVKYSVKDNNGNVTIATREVMVGNIGKANMNVGTPGVVYLTFDDGPSSNITPQILDILKEKGVKATFFVLDYGQNTEHLIKRIVEEGHSIAIHGGSHDYATVYSSADSYLNGLDYMKEKIKNTTGVETRTIRFPGGSSNTVSRKYCEGVMSTLVRETLKRGYRYFDWNVASGDSGGVKTSEGVYNNVTQGLKNTRSNVVLMHDFSGNQKSVDALPGIIDFAKQNGYTFDRITDKTPMVTQNVQN